jgi:acid phosphatase (class A)
LPGSPEQAADLSETISVSKTCPAADAAQAKAEKKFSIFVFTPAIGSFFQSNTLPKTTAFFERVHSDTEAVTDTAKNFWKRPRPYVVEPSLSNGEPEKSFSYPSGHSTRATVYALLLAELFPDRKDEILAVGRDVGWHRVEIARHYPTDIYAGRALAQAIVREMKASPAFQHDFAEAKNEIAAMRPAPKTAVDTASPIAAHP